MKNNNLKTTKYLNILIIFSVILSIFMFIFPHNNWMILPMGAVALLMILILPLTYYLFLKELFDLNDN